MPTNKPVKYVPASPNYEAFFQNGLSSEGEDLYMYEKDNHDQDSGGQDEQRRPAKLQTLFEDAQEESDSSDAEVLKQSALLLLAPEASSRQQSQLIQLQSTSVEPNDEEKICSNDD